MGQKDERDKTPRNVSKATRETTNYGVDGQRVMLEAFGQKQRFELVEAGRWTTTTTTTTTTTP